MSFREKMLAALNKKETDSSQRSFRFTRTGGILPWKIDRANIGL
jgi:hypothetical protein